METTKEGLLTVKDKSGVLQAIIYKDTSKSEKHCVFYKVEEMAEDDLQELLKTL